VQANGWTDFYLKQLDAASNATRPQPEKETLMDYGWPQLVMLAIFAVAIGTESANHGRSKRGHHNAFFIMVCVAVEVGILKAGGFF